MAEVIMSAEVDYLDEEWAPNGAGFYYTLDGGKTASGPFISDEEAIAAVTKLLEVSAAEFIKQALIPE